MWRDKQFGAALVAAPFFWVLLLAAGFARADFAWPWFEPVSFLLLALAHPVLEEVVFRGGLQPWLLQTTAGARSFAGFTLANLLTSLAFTALHFFFHPPLWAAAVFVPSLIFGYFRDRHRSLQGPVVLHLFYNAGYYWLFGPNL